MKKSLIVLIALISINLPGFAILTTEDSTSIKYIEHHGYSDETARLIDLQKSQINGTEPTYTTPPAWYDDKLPNWCDEKKVSFIRKVFMYFDCGLDNGKFMQNNIDYTSRYDDL
jgi:hypothetical protein